MGKGDRPSGERSRRHRFAVEAVLLVLVIAGVALAASRLGLLRDLERRIDDTAVAYFTADAAAAHERLAVVAIDDATVRAHPPRSPVNRALLAELLAIVDGGGPAAIGLDVFLLETSESDDDRSLARALAAARRPVVLATPMRGGKAAPLAPLFAATGAEAAVANLPLDLGDRTLRAYRTGFGDAEGRLHATLSAVLARRAGKAVEITPRDRPIDWYGRPGWQDPGPIALFSAQMLLEKPFLARLLEDRVVLIGPTFEGSGDVHRTPFSRLGSGEGGLAGVLAHAQVVAQLLDGRARRLPGARLTSVVVLAAAVLGALLALLRVPAYVPLACAVLAPVAWIAIVFAVRRQGGMALPALSPALAVGLALASFALFRARRFERAQRIAARALNSYLPRSLARRVLNDPGMLRLGGEPRTLTILFTDIAGFTSYAERHDPERVVTVLNAYLDRMAEIVLANHGTLDKFIGDAVMAFFGAPGADPHHAVHAIACALEMHRFSAGFAAEHGIETRIGVHSGPVVVGNVGGESRFDYTVIGDAVNLASRLEGANRYLGLSPESSTRVCISGDTVELSRRDPAHPGRPSLTGAELRAAPEAPCLRPVGHILVKGREAPLMVYTTLPEWFGPEHLDAYTGALEAFERGEREAARAAFDALDRDRLSAFQSRRCIDQAGQYLRLEAK